MSKGPTFRRRYRAAVDSFADSVYTSARKIAECAQQNPDISDDAIRSFITTFGWEPDRTAEHRWQRPGMLEHAAEVDVLAACLASYRENADGWPKVFEACWKRPDS
jgi:hypothetical protein